MDFVVYVIQSQTTGKLYIGQTSDLNTRFKRHNHELPSKATSYTSKNKGPWNIVYSEIYKTRSEAKIREKQLKSYQGRQFIKRQLESKTQNTSSAADPPAGGL